MWRGGSEVVFGVGTVSACGIVRRGEGRGAGTIGVSTWEGASDGLLLHVVEGRLR